MLQTTESSAGRPRELDPRYLSADERRAQGKARRQASPRQDHGSWEPPKSRPDPVELVVASNKGRVAELVPIRFARMLQSPFAFYRGSAALMAADLALTPKSGLLVQACGDAHLLNFGGFATPERNVIFDINDLDETLPAPWEWDLKRLAASVVIAGRHIGLSESDIARTAIGTVRGYRERMTDYSAMRALEIWYDTITLKRVLKEMAREEDRGRIAERVAKAQVKSTPEYIFPQLAEERGTIPRILDNPPLIYHPTADQAPGIETRYAEAIAMYRQSLPENVRVLFDRFTFCDLAFKVVGVGSVGTWCGVALFLAADDDPIFLQIKEAGPSVLEPYAGASAYTNHGERVVAGQRLMQAASDILLGWTKGVSGRHFYLRQLRDAKISAIVEGFDLDLMQTYAGLCAWALARAHARSGDPAMIAGYMGASETFDDAIGEFAMEYADQNERDYRAFVRAVKEGRIAAAIDV